MDALRTMLDDKVSRLVVLSTGGKVMGVLSIEDVIGTPALVAWYDCEDKLEVERDLNNEAKALMRLLEEAEIALRH